MARILGISSFYHDSAAALLDNGKIIAAVQEERFTRVKHDPSFPINSIKFCLDYSSLDINNIDYIVFYEKPFVKFERILETYLSNIPKGLKFFCSSLPSTIKEKLFLKQTILRILKENFDCNKAIADKLLFCEHHMSHAASVFYTSSFQSSIILVLDGVGEKVTTTVSFGKGNNIQLLKEIHFPHSIGLLYSAFTYYLGFKVNSGEYKVMGLAPYGEPKYVKKILDNLITIYDDGSFKLNMKYFNFSKGLTMINSKFISLFNTPRRKPKEKIEKFHMNIASSIQATLEHIIINLVKKISEKTTCTNLCLAGGVALNCVANSKIKKLSNFKNIWIQPACGDAGGALGSALCTHYEYLNNKRKITSKDKINHGYLGSKFYDDQIELKLNNLKANYTKYETEEDLIKYVAQIIAKNNIVGWFQGRSEFGPRALGNRSILANPLCPEMQKKLNLKIKFRESFRPFAPAIILEDCNEWFDTKEASPYMLFTAYVKESKRVKENKKSGKNSNLIKYIRTEIPAVTHVDFSARIQTVTKESNILFYKLLKEFKKITKCPILINTSFNIRGEPIVNSPEDAFNCFINTDMDYLVIGKYLLKKKEQDKNLFQYPYNSYKKKFNLRD